MREKLGNFTPNILPTHLFKILILFFSFLSLFFKLWKYDNTFTGDLENTEQNYI